LITNQSSTSAEGRHLPVSSTADALPAGILAGINPADVIYNDAVSDMHAPATSHDPISVAQKWEHVNYVVPSTSAGSIDKVTTVPTAYSHLPIFHALQPVTSGLQGLHILSPPKPPPSMESDWEVGG
jgi:hypothetical protein